MAEGVNVLKKVYVGNRVHFRHVDGLLYPGRVVKVGRANSDTGGIHIEFLPCRVKNGQILHTIEQMYKCPPMYFPFLIWNT